MGKKDKKLEKSKKKQKKASKGLFARGQQSVAEVWKRSMAPFLNKKVDADELFKKLFPRTIDSLIATEQTSDGKWVAVQDSISPGIKRFNSFEVPDEMLALFKQTFIGWQLCALLQQNVYIDRACSIPPKDAMAPGFKLISRIKSRERNKVEIAGNEINDEFLETFRDDSVKRYKIDHICTQAVIKKRVFGGALVVPVVEGANMELPFNIDGIKKGSYRGMKVIEPYWIMPELDVEATRDPSSLHFYEPTHYRIAGQGRIHRSWVIRLVNSEVSDILKPVYFFWGISIVQQIYERIYSLIRVANEAPLLALTKRLLVADGDIAEYMANPEHGDEAMRLLAYFRDNFGVYVKSPENNISQIDTALADFDELVMTQAQLAAAEAGIPLVKYFKTTPKGFNSTGDFEIKDYNQSLVSIQNDDYTRIIDLHDMLLSKSRYGVVIPLCVRFNPIDAPTEEQIAKINELESISLLHYVSGGIITIEEAREFLRNRPNSGFSTLALEPPIELEIAPNPDTTGKKDLSGKYIENSGRDVS